MRISAAGSRERPHAAVGLSGVFLWGGDRGEGKTKSLAKNISGQVHCRGTLPLPIPLAAISFFQGRVKCNMNHVQ